MDWPYAVHTKIQKRVYSPHSVHFHLIQRGQRFSAISYMQQQDNRPLNSSEHQKIVSLWAQQGVLPLYKAAVAHGNHRVDPETLHHPLKKIIAVVKRKAEIVLSGETATENSDKKSKGS